MDPTWIVVLLGAFLVALLYASVGHGGASGYLAVLVLAGYARPQVTPVVLCLNALVASIGFVQYRRAGHFSARLLLPFALTSVPAALVGSLVPLTDRGYTAVLGMGLAAAAIRFVLWPVAGAAAAVPAPPRLWLFGPPVGLALGLLAGSVGIGGGIFLSPLLLQFGWADAKRTAAVSSAFIVVNSLVGLTGHVGRGATIDGGLLAPLAAVVAAGGALGAFVGATRLSAAALQRLLGVVLATAAAKLLLGTG